MGTLDATGGTQVESSRAPWRASREETRCIRKAVATVHRCVAICQVACAHGRQPVAVRAIMQGAPT